MAYNTPETVADYLARFQMEITLRGKGTFTPDHVKYSLTIASGGKDFFTTFESNPHVHGEPTITQVFGALASDAMVVRDYGMDEFVDEFCDGMKPSAAIRVIPPCGVLRYLAGCRTLPGRAVRLSLLHDRPA